MKIIMVPCLHGYDISVVAQKLQALFGQPSQILCEAVEVTRVAARNAVEAIGRGVRIDNAGVIDKDRIRRELGSMSLQRGDPVYWAFVSRTGKAKVYELDAAGELKPMALDLSAVQLGVSQNRREEVA